MKNFLALLLMLTITLQAIAGPGERHTRRYHSRVLRRIQRQRNNRVYHFHANRPNVWPVSAVNR